jgi:molybdopterin synthase catalytic subunit/molybdopterin converting factor small subunit
VNITVKLFVGLREKAGADEIDLELPDDARVRDAIAAIDHLAPPGMCLVLAVNRVYAAEDQRLSPGDELAVVPPVSGGAPDEGPAPRIHVALREEALDLAAIAARVADPRAGAVVTFDGRTRDVPHLDYEAYAEMAEPVLREIAREAADRHGLLAVAVEHRVGRVPLGEASVLVAASSGHRPEAFAGAREVIDALKDRAPIWKKEEGAWKHESVPEVPARDPAG